jgi:hypothetical protein
MGDDYGDADGDPTFAQSQNLDYTDFAGNHTHIIGINSDGIHSHTGTSDDTGSGDTIDNRPAYYTLAFIMKL